ncbi:MAG: hypothetical protein K0S17_4165 [Enterobacter mori]|nr:hypothetical protein [Enterobacter mori]
MVSEYLHYSGKRLRYALDVAGIQTRHAHTTAGDQVNAELFAQAIDLRRAQSGVAEHSALLEQVVEVMPPFSFSSPRTVATTCAPKFGGLE